PSGASVSIQVNVGSGRENPFTDVEEGKFYYEPVLWAYYHNPQIATGTSKTKFSPNNPCTRAQIVTFLWRAAGSPEPETTENPFEDVKESQYYYKAVLWAAETGVTTGTSKTKFSPDNGCTRAQAVTFLWRFAGKPEPTASTNPFEDVPEGAYYTKAVLWAAETGVTTGTGKTKFSPNNPCTRAQIVTFLWRYMRE
ncbi:MAG: S-layer homology domain-containing protein, partial [Acidaminococcaceae bacterium]|nr:S-layer homology domain-containing protein [Acidaminococcaceae bacterium]